MTEEIIIDKEDKEKKHRNNEIDCLHFSCRKGESGKVLLWCDFYDDHCDNYTGCYYRKYLRLEQENEKLKKEVKQIGSDFIKKGDYARELEQENKELKQQLSEIGKNWGEIDELRKQVEAQKGLITVGSKQQYNMTIAYDKLKTALEEIKTYLSTLSSIDSDFPNTETYLRIQDKINEVLNDSES